jgi:hypothetical protein
MGPGPEGELGPAEGDGPGVEIASTYEDDGVNEYPGEEDIPGGGTTTDDEFPAGMEGPAGKDV